MVSSLAGFQRDDRRSEYDGSFWRGFQDGGVEEGAGRRRRRLWDFEDGYSELYQTGFIGFGVALVFRCGDCGSLPSLP